MERISCLFWYFVGFLVLRSWDCGVFGDGCALVPVVMRYRRMHADGIDALIVEESLRWRVQLRFRQHGGRAAFSLCWVGRSDAGRGAGAC